MIRYCFFIYDSMLSLHICLPWSKTATRKEAQCHDLIIYQLKPYYSLEPVVQENQVLGVAIAEQSLHFLQHDIHNTWGQRYCVCIICLPAFACLDISYWSWPESVIYLCSWKVSRVQGPKYHTIIKLVSTDGNKEPWNESKPVKQSFTHFNG